MFLELRKTHVKKISDQKSLQSFVKALCCKLICLAFDSSLCFGANANIIYSYSAGINWPRTADATGAN